MSKTKAQIRKESFQPWGPSCRQCKYCHIYDYYKEVECRVVPKKSIDVEKDNICGLYERK